LIRPTKSGADKVCSLDSDDDEVQITLSRSAKRTKGIAASGTKNELGSANKKACAAVEQELLPSDPEDSDKAPFSPL